MNGIPTDCAFLVVTIGSWSLFFA